MNKIIDIVGKIFKDFGCVNKREKKGLSAEKEYSILKY
jgi:hypothetical protein